jgi:hypothetical protein
MEKNKIIVEAIIEPSKYVKCQDDKIIRQTFTCCNTQLEKFLWEGWDWTHGDIISSDIIKDFKYCPYCGKELEAEYEANT